MDKTIYWNYFYKNNYDLLNNPSSFCLFVLDYFKNISINTILDAGCGNGRDTYVFGEKYNVLGIDLILQIPKNINNCKFIIGDFCSYDKTNFDMIYSRFTLHSITNEEQKKFISSINKNTYLCIETRSDKSIDSYRFFGDTHYRNFTNLEYLKKLLNDNNFDILYLEENNDFAIFNDENPICIRIICKKI